MSKTSVQNLFQEYRDLELDIILTEEIIGLVLREFGARDGIEPKNVIVTDAGQPIPTTFVDKLVSRIRDEILEPKIERLDQIKEIDIEY